MHPHIQKNCKTLFILLAFLIFGQIGIAQDFSLKPGKVTEAEFNLKACPIDSSAEAMVFYDIAKLSFIVIGDSYQTLYERTLKIKVLTKAGITHADFSIPYYLGSFGTERVTGLKGVTYNMENGEVRETKLSSKNVFDEKDGEYNFNKKFAMPDVKEGSIFEISYKISSPYITFLPTWRFQKSIPVLLSQYSVTMNPIYEYKSILKGAGRLDEYEVTDSPEEAIMIMGGPHKSKTHRYLMRNLQGFKDESYITSAEDYLVKLDFQLTAIHYSNGQTESFISTWPKLCEELIVHDDFVRYMKAAERRSKEMVEKLKLTSLSKTEKAKIIEKYVKKNFTHNGSDYYLATKSIGDFEESKTGNCANINLYLAGMLNAAGILTEPVMLSTRDNGKIPISYPFVSNFNYVLALAKLDSSVVLLDATEPLSDFGVIPSRCLNDIGLVVQPKETQWLEIESKNISSELYEFILKPDPSNDSVYQESKMITEGYKAIRYRNKYLKDYEDLAKELIGDDYLSFDSIRQSNLLNVDEPFVVEFNRTTEMEMVEDKLIIEPFCDQTYTENPLKQLKRTYPVDFNYKSRTAYSTTIEIPEGYRLLTKPENLIVNNKIVKIVYTINELENKVVITALYELKKQVYEPVSYPELKATFDKIVSKFNEKLVFVKTII